MKRPALRLSVLVTTVITACLIGWAWWPRDPELSAYELSAKDGKSRFHVTRGHEFQPSPDSSLLERLSQRWRWYQRRRQIRQSALYAFSSSSWMQDLEQSLEQCADLTGTEYSVAVEIRGATDFTTTNRLTGIQWVAEFEHHLETNGPMACYDWGRKREFVDQLLVIRERPGRVKIIPRSKLADYQKAGLVEVNVR